MKKASVLLFTIIFLGGILNAQNNPFEKIMDMQGVDVVYISKAMLNVKSLDLHAAPMNLGGMVGKLNSVTIIDSDNEAVVKNIKREVREIVKRENYEQVMYIKDDDSRTIFYSKMDKNSKNNEFLMVEEEEDEITIIRIEGEISKEDIQQLTQ